jgi:F1F0 ATPase subunit 2
MTEMAIPAMFAELVIAGPTIKALVGTAVGAGIGALHFGSLWWSVQAGADGGALHFIAMAALRWSFTIALFGALAMIGAPALFGGALGLLAARHVILRQIRRRT